MATKLLTTWFSGQSKFIVHFSATMNSNQRPDHQIDTSEMEHMEDAGSLDESLQLFRAKRRILAVRALAKALILSYPIIVLPAFLPFAFAEATWMQSVIDALIGQAAIPIVGIGLLLISNNDSEEAQPARKLLVIISSLTIFAMIGYGLIVPLQIATTVRSLLVYDKALSAQYREIRGQRQYDFGMITSVQTKKDLDNLIPLELAALRKQANALPLPKAKKLLLKGMEDRSKALLAEITNRRNQSYTMAVKTALRNVLLAIIFAFCYNRLRYKYMFPNLTDELGIGTYSDQET